MSEVKSAKEHYEKLIKDGNDPVHDNEMMQKYMNRWTCDDFIDYLGVTQNMKVLEVGVGTGRLAKRVLEVGCQSYLGIDISPNTIRKAKENLIAFNNADFIECNILDYNANNNFDLVFSVLTFQHIQDKKQAIGKIVDSLDAQGRVVLSLDNIKSEYLDYGSHKTEVYHNDIDEITAYLIEKNCVIENVKELKENDNLIATLIKCQKGKA